MANAKRAKKAKTTKTRKLGKYETAASSGVHALAAASLASASVADAAVAFVTAYRESPHNSGVGEFQELERAVDAMESLHAKLGSFEA